MTKNDQPLTKEQFDTIYAKVPRLTVEIVVKDPEGRLYITQRAIEPCKGQWHIPGGTVRFGEPLQQAVRRIALRELGIEVEDTKQVGIIEYPSHYQHNLDHPVGIVFEVTSFSGAFAPNDEAMDSGWFDHIPSPFHADQSEFLVENHYLTS